jgi:hypothetical protein
VARSVRTLFLVASVAIVTAFGVVAQAQTCTTPEAQLTSPADGSTLVPDPVTGLVTFTWCNASADYFVTIETFPGAHDLFFNFVGGEGGGFTSLSLSPSCLPTLPRACIPPNGEHLTFGLQTTKAKQLLGAHRYSFTAPTAASTKPDFAITSSKSALAIPAAGASASTSLTVTGQAGYNGIVNFSCSGLPANSSCSFTPFTVGSGGNTTMTIATAARQAAALQHPRSLDWFTSIAGSSFAVVLIVGVPARRKRIGLSSAILLLVVLGSILSFVGCGGAAAPKQAPTVTAGTPAGTFTVTVTASDGVLTHTTAVTLTVP